MNLHTRGVFPGKVPDQWLDEQNLSICNCCQQLVARSRFVSHLRRCTALITPSGHVPKAAQNSDTAHHLPTFEEVCQLRCPTLRHIPAKSRPAFARALSISLQAVLQKNSTEAWLMLFSLPKCLLPSAKHRGRHN